MRVRSIVLVVFVVLAGVAGLQVSPEVRHAGVSRPEVEVASISPDPPASAPQIVPEPAAAPPRTDSPAPEVPESPQTVPEAHSASLPEPVVDVAEVDWDGVARCETGGDWSMRGSSYSGGLGFANATWDAFGGREFAANAGDATREQQIVVAERVRAANGGSLYGAWGCAAYG